MVKILHFADAHIDMTTQGKRDPETGLPVRVMDCLKSLDAIVDAAINKGVDLVLFAGDAYKDRNPHPTYQREWGKRIMRLSRAGIPTVMIPGNHDISPAAGRAHTLTEFKTLKVPHVIVADMLVMFDAGKHFGRIAQIMAIPWIPRSHLMTRAETEGMPLEQVYQLIEEKILMAVDQYLEKRDPKLPTILLSHTSALGARYSSERMVSLGRELVLPQSLVTDERFDYVALGHIHRHQVLNEDPPVIYAGSIERMDFGEAGEQKGYILAEVEAGRAEWEFVPLPIRPMIDVTVILADYDTATIDVEEALPSPDKLEGAIVRLVVEYPGNWDTPFNETAIEELLESALEYKIVKRKTAEARARLGDIAKVESMSPAEVMELYWKAVGTDAADAERWQRAAVEIIANVEET